MVAKKKKTKKKKSSKKNAKASATIEPVDKINVSAIQNSDDE